MKARKLFFNQKFTRFSKINIRSSNFFYSTVRFTKDHEWVRIDGNIATVGITDYAQKALGDLVYVDLPEVGDKFNKGDSFGSVESVKAASDVYSPLNGTVTEVNEKLRDDSSLVNKDAQGEGWLAKFQVEKQDDSHLLDQSSYTKLVDSLKKDK